MAKIKSVELESIPEIINVGDDITDIIVNTSIEFHKLDISLKMEYELLLFVYDINGKIDIPVIIGNWDETQVYGVSNDRNDHLLGQINLLVIAENDKLEVNTPIALKLGNLEKGDSYTSREIEVFATLIPAIGRASKWSKPFESSIVF